MAERSVFDKIHIDESNKADLGSVLEQLNLPPAVVKFVRKNQRAIALILGVVVVIVVIWALYGSYQEKRIVDSSAALTTAQTKKGEEKTVALQSVVEDYSGTAASLWAKVELAHNSIIEADYASALQHYRDVRRSIKDTNPLFPLVTFGIAQTEEFLSNYDAAFQEYSLLKTTVGFESLGYYGTARIYEVKGENDSAVRELREYLGSLIGNGPESAEKIYINEKINHLRDSL